MKCNHCGQELIPGAKFCNHCGQPVLIEQPQPQPQPQVQEQPHVQEQSQFQPQQQIPQGDFNVYQNPGFNGSMPPPQQPNKQVPGYGLGIAAMIVGIASLAFLSIAGAIVGLILSIKATNLAKEAGMTNSMAKAGLVCSIVGLAVSVLFSIVLLALLPDLLDLYFYGLFLS